MKKVSIIVSLCSIQFYLAMQTIGQTEATFSSQASTEQVVSAAIVFPKTIQTHLVAAKVHSSKANQLYESMINTSVNGASDSELSDLLNNVLNEEQELYEELKSLHTIQEEMNSYQSQIQALSKAERSSYEYVSSSYQEVKQLSLQINKTINLQEIKKIKSSIQEKIKDRTEKVEKNNGPQSNTDSVKHDTNSKSVQNETDSVINNTESIQNDTDSVKNNTESVQNDLDSVKNNPKSVQNDTDSVQNNADSVQNETSDNSNNKTQNE
ncbi:DUF4047 domain-containing protein [Bacillus sp. AFS041924]|uniref:DUF4047 domain-containing protein n=1 Tax=Bacillus sp. AFS041924 TaxID=2033503 RepID=UPI000BFD75FB|nr:DUF4047 domain-containing protein [Bacillus sp. AFS041924]PGS55881.1 hypothetical protein COC46_02675 [Bacillus sp. AFS041924]